MIVMQKTIGVLLLVAGIAMLIWSGFSYTKREKVLDAGPVHISADRQKTVTWPPYAGGVLVVAGVVVLVAGRGRRSGGI
jgi:drug/metabolite transporter (DMT)-like permease